MGITNSKFPHFRKFRRFRRLKKKNLSDNVSETSVDVSVISQNTHTHSNTIDDTHYILRGGDESIHPWVLNHYIAREVWGNNYSCPCEDLFRTPGTKALDLGSGPGTWVMEMAIDYPLTHFTGVELDELYPKDIKPTNTTFVQTDLLSGLPFPDNSFDYVRSAYMIFSFTVDDWKKTVIPEIIRITKPGGWIEIMEWENIWSDEGPVTQNFRTMAHDYYRNQMGLEPVLIIPFIQGALKSSPDIMSLNPLKKTAPVGGGGGKIGKLNLEIIRYGFGSVADNLLPVFGMTREEYDKTLAEMEKEFNEREVYINIFRLCARKKILD